MVGRMDKDQARFDFLVAQEADLREEVKNRVSQRDSFAVQMMIAMGVILALSLSNFANFKYLIFLLPVITLFYCVQIISSYSIHDSLVSFIKNNIEREIAILIAKDEEDPAKISEMLMWQTNRDLTENKHGHGMRRKFFVYTALLSPIITLILFLLFCNEYGDIMWFDVIVGITLTVLYMIMTILAVIRVKRRSVI